MGTENRRHSALASSQEYYAHRAHYYDLFFQRSDASKKDLQLIKELDFLERAFKSGASRPVKNILDVACGWGRHVVGLAERGYRCSGSDLTLECIEAARTRAERAGVTIDLSVADATKLPTKSRFDAVLALYIIFLLPNDEDILKCLRRIHDLVLPGGVVVCNIYNPFTKGENWISDPVRCGPRVYESKAGGIRWLSVTKPTDFDPVQGVAWIEETTVIEGPDGRHVFRDRERARLLTYWDVTRYLHDTGFRKVEVYPDWSTQPKRRPKAEQLIFVARK